MPPLLRLSAGCAARTGQPRGGADRRLRASRAPWPRRTVQNPARRTGLYLFHVGLPRRGGGRLARRSLGDDAAAPRSGVFLHHQADRTAPGTATARLGRRLRERHGRLHGGESGGCRPAAAAFPRNAPPPPGDRLCAAARTDRPHVLARARGRGGLRRRRVGQRRTAMRLRMGPRAPRAVRGRRSFLHLPPDRRPVRQGGAPLPHSPGTPARPGPQGGYRLPPGTIAPKRCPEPECGRNGNRTERTARKKPPPDSARQQKNPALRPKKRKSRKLNGYGNRYQSFDEASGAACE